MKLTNEEPVTFEWLNEICPALGSRENSFEWLFSGQTLEQLRTCFRTLEIIWVPGTQHAHADVVLWAMRSAIRIGIGDFRTKGDVRRLLEALPVDLVVGTYD